MATKFSPQVLESERRSSEDSTQRVSPSAGILPTSPHLLCPVVFGITLHRQLSVVEFTQQLPGGGGKHRLLCCTLTDPISTAVSAAAAGSLDKNTVF